MLDWIALKKYKHSNTKLKIRLFAKKTKNVIELSFRLTLKEKEQRFIRWTARVALFSKENL